MIPAIILIGILLTVASIFYLNNSKDIYEAGMFAFLMAISVAVLLYGVIV